MTEKQVSAFLRENKKLRAELERNNREKIEYLQNVSHQLVAPLNAIKWEIENITSGRVGVERAKKVFVPYTLSPPLQSIWQRISH